MISSLSSPGVRTLSVAQFQSDLDALAAAALPIKPLCTDTIGSGVARYFRMDSGDISLGAPWVIIEADPASGAAFALIAGEGTRLFNPSDALDALREDCRERLLEAGVEPAF